MSPLPTLSQLCPPPLPAAFEPPPQALLAAKAEELFQRWAEPLEEDASERVEKVSAGGSRLVGEISFFKLRKLVMKVCQISCS